MAGLFALCIPFPASAQALVDPLVPAGRVRLDFTPRFITWGARYGLKDDGTSVLEPLGSDLTDPVGASLFPGIQTLEQSLAAVSGYDAYRARLGSTAGRVTLDVTRIDAGFRLGVFDWLTVGATAPFVKSRSTIDLAFRPDTLAPDLGLNPALTGSESVTTLLSGLETAAAAADARATSVCGAGAGGCDAAQALAQRANAFWGQMMSAYFASPFFPMASSPVAGGLQTALALLDADLTAAGLMPVGATVAFADQGLGPDDLADLTSNPAAGIQGSALQSAESLWALGDVELTADVRLLHHDTEARPSGHSGLSYSLSGGALVRLGTGQVDDPDVFFDVGSGDGQTDIEGHLDGALRFGRRLALRAGVRYGVQNARTLVRRVARHEVVLAPAVNRRWVRWSPGAYSLLALSPRLHLNDAVSLAVDYHRWHKGADEYELFGPEPEGLPSVDPTLLGVESEMTLQELGFGVRYSAVQAWREGAAGIPVEAGIRVLLAAGGSGGRTPKTTRVEFSVSLFRRLWGRH